MNRIWNAVRPPARRPRGFTASPTTLAQHILYYPRDAAHALPRRLACRLRWHNRLCYGDLRCRRERRRRSST